MSPRSVVSRPIPPGLSDTVKWLSQVLIEENDDYYIVKTLITYLLL